MSDAVRLNKYLSASGFCSRRKADEWIASGKVYVNGIQADIGMRVKDEDEISVNGKQIKRELPFKLVVFYKPKGYACTSHSGDKSGIFRNFDLSTDLKYVGRLDKDSEGVLLLTNDGDLCNEIAKARNQHEKEYIVTVNRTITPEFLKGMEQGVKIYNPNKDVWVTTNPCKIIKIKDKTFKIILTQGLNRQIRKMCEHFEYKVLNLKRIRVMNIELTGMKSGEIRMATPDEVYELKKRIASNERSN